MGRIGRYAAVLALAAAVAVVPVGARAEEPPARAPTAARKVLRLEALTVEGKLQKPEAFYILQRANPEFDDLGRPESFLPKVVESQRNEIF